MAYLVVMVVDSSPHEAGDVISWRDENLMTFEGHYGIGTKTLQDERFKIVHVPDMSNDEANGLCRAQAGLSREMNRATKEWIPKNLDAKIRAFKFNVNALNGRDKADMVRANKSKEQRFSLNDKGFPTMLDVVNLELPLARFNAAKELKPLIDNRPSAFVREIR